MTGMDLNGPTAVFKSVCRIDHRRCPNGAFFNEIHKDVQDSIIERTEQMI